MERVIRVRGARQNNLKGLDVDILHDTLTVVTGPSGSGKSSLAFDTVYAEGQRRYVESLSTYAKQFLERMPKPDADRIDGVRPSVAIDQRNAVRTSRSTVGTITEVYDYLRLLWSRVGETWCPSCGVRVVPDTVQSAADEVLELPAGSRVLVVFPFDLRDGRSAGSAAETLRAQGFVRALADGAEVRIDDAADAEEEADRLARAEELLVVMDRLAVDLEERERLADALASAFSEGHGHASALVVERAGDASAWRTVQRLDFTEQFRCTGCGRRFPDPRPLLFSFNHPTGACPECNGFGATLEYDEGLIVPDPELSLAEGAIDPWSKPRYRRERARLLELARDRGVSPDEPWISLPDSFREIVLHGGPGFEGVFDFLRGRESKKYKRYIRVFLRRYQRPRTCAACGGARLRPEALNVRVEGRTIADAAALDVAAFSAWLDGLALPPFEAKVAETVLRELSDRARFLDRVGLGYLTLDRQARTLSGGEMQRIRLAGSLGSRLVDTLYVLDEPTIGLHPRDTERLIGVVRALRDRGNTVLVVEHDTALLRAADRIVELGPGAGEKGGEVVFEGGFAELRTAGTATGKALSRPVPRPRDREPEGGWIELRGARLHNLRGVDVRLPRGALTVVTGVSGSGKSTLVHDILYRALERELHGATSAREHLGEETGRWSELRGVGALEEAVLVDQSPIGRSSRSNPVTYVKAWDEIRKVFAGLADAKRRGWGPGHFSFNVKGGCCEACKGTGEEIVEMVFLADVSVPCEVCAGARFKPEVLEVRYRGLNVREVLDLTVDEAIRFFLRRDRVGAALWQLQRVGLGYLRLGQPATTLSGGEAQRLKIARELARPARGRRRRLYLLDEPTTGLGLGEIERLVSVLDQLVEAGHTVVVVEHNLDVVARADWVVDLGPGAAAEGGEVVVAGPPAEVARCGRSHTGRYLAAYLGNAAAGESGEREELAG